MYVDERATALNFIAIWNQFASQASNRSPCIIDPSESAVLHYAATYANLPMKVHDDHLSPSDVQKVSHVFDDGREGGDPDDIMIDPESAYVIALLDGRAVGNWRIITDSDVEIPYAVH